MSMLQNEPPANTHQLYMYNTYTDNLLASFRNAAFLSGNDKLLKSGLAWLVVGCENYIQHRWTSVQKEITTPTSVSS